MVYSWLVNAIKDLRQGARLCVVGHLNGTVFTPADGVPSHGLQIIADAVTFPAARERSQDVGH